MHEQEAPLEPKISTLSRVVGSVWLAEPTMKSFSEFSWGGNIHTPTRNFNLRGPCCKTIHSSVATSTAHPPWPHDKRRRP